VQGSANMRQAFAAGGPAEDDGFADAPAPIPNQPEVNTPVVKSADEKVGRNEPCPCGSGRKYKHCHGS